MNHRSRFIDSLRHAWSGLLLAFSSEKSFRLLLMAACGVFVIIVLLPLKDWERVMMLLATGSVLVLELLNSMIERLVDLVKPRMHGYVHDIKDLMAATVLLASLFAFAVVSLIVWPHLSQVIHRV
ncbi:diacylglycerol kinase [Patescibacteria group bacterium]|nr:diacylglycerol kinase [Patescibacteria group bacterium]